MSRIILWLMQGVNWYHRKTDDTDEVLHKPVL